MNVSSVASAVTSMKFAETIARVQYAVAAKILDQQRDHGDTVIQLIESANSNFEASVADLDAALGGALDVQG